MRGAANTARKTRNGQAMSGPCTLRNSLCESAPITRGSDLGPTPTMALTIGCGCGTCRVFALSLPHKKGVEAPARGETCGLSC